MARRKPKRIAVESRTREQRLVAACRYLEVVDMACLDKVLAAAEAFVSTYDNPNEPYGEFKARIDAITGRGDAAN